MTGDVVGQQNIGISGKIRVLLACAQCQKLATFMNLMKFNVIIKKPQLLNILKVISNYNETTLGDLCWWIDGTLILSSTR